MDDNNFQDTEENLFSSASSDYRAQKLLGCGTFGEVLQCRNLTSNETVALKFIRHNRHIEEAQHEVQRKLCLSIFHLHIALKTNCIHPKRISNISYIPQEALLKKIQALNSDKFNIVRWIDSFIYEGLYCLEFEKLDINLHQFVWRSPSQSLALKEIRPILQQVSFCNTKFATQTAF